MAHVFHARKETKMANIKIDDVVSLRMGEILVAKENLTAEVEGSKRKEIISKGSMAIIGFDKRLHHYNGNTSSLDEEAVKLEGYCASGLASYICDKLKTKIPLEDMLESYEIPEINLIDEIAFILMEIGMTE